MPTRMATNVARAPRPSSEERIVAAAFGDRRRFLRQDRHGAWAVTLDEREALGFRDAGDAAAAIKDYERRNLDRFVHGDPGVWQVYRMKLTTSFAPA